MKFLIILGLFLAQQIAMASTPSPLRVDQAFAKFGVDWGHVFNYEGRYTVQGILHKFFPHEDGKQVLSKLGFRSGVVPTDDMLTSLQHAVEDDQDLLVRDYREPLRRLTISTKVERVLSQLNESAISVDESLSSGQKLSLNRAIALRDAYAYNSPDTMDKAIKAIRDHDIFTLSYLINSAELNPNLPIVSGMPLLGFAARMHSILEGQLYDETSRGSDPQQLREIRQKLADSTDLLNWLVLQTRVNLDATDDRGRTFIGMAARESSFDALKLALRRGMSVDSVDGIGNTPLLTHLIFGTGPHDLWVEKIKFLVGEAKAQINISNDNGTTPLLMIVAYEAKWGGTKLTEYFLERGADVNDGDQLKRLFNLAHSGGNDDLAYVLFKRWPHGVRE